MLKLDELLATYQAIKAHENDIMARRPPDTPRAAWRMENPHGMRSSFRVIKNGKSLSAILNYDTAPFLTIMAPTGKGSRVLEQIDLRAEDAAERLAAYALPASNDMTSFEFAEIRKRLGLTQVQLAPLLDLGSLMRVSELERATNPRPIPKYIARIMNAMDAGWRPSDWPATIAA